MSNAAKFATGTDPEVRISVGRSSEGSATVEVYFRDNGPGIPPDVRETLFQKFSRGWSANYKTDSGSGLGLAISKRIMLLMKGDLILTDTGPEGTCFAICLLRADDTATGAQ